MTAKLAPLPRKIPIGITKTTDGCPCHITSNCQGRYPEYLEVDSLLDDVSIRDTHPTKPERSSVHKAVPISSDTPSLHTVAIIHTFIRPCHTSHVTCLFLYFLCPTQCLLYTTPRHICPPSPVQNATTSPTKQKCPKLYPVIA